MSTSEMIVIFLLALVVFGPKRLPEIARQLGKAIAEFKRASYEFRSQLEDEIRQIDAAELARKQAQPLLAPAENTIAQQPSAPELPVILPATTASASASSLEPAAPGPEDAAGEDPHPTNAPLAHSSNV